MTELKKFVVALPIEGRIVTTTVVARSRMTAIQAAAQDAKFQGVLSHQADVRFTAAAVELTDAPVEAADKAVKEVVNHLR